MQDKSNAKKFLNLVLHDTKVKHTLLELYKKGAKREIEELTKSVGFPCTFSELQEVSKDVAELDANHLKIAQGGKGWDNNWSEPAINQEWWYGNKP